LVITDDKDFAAVIPLDRITAGKRAERWHQTDAFTQPETRQPQTLAALAMQPINRMHMSGQHMPLRMWLGLVLQGEWAQQ
jgi:hypothetical protein